jgi:hypothetical protein
MKAPIPDHLLSTLKLVERTYPGGVPDSEYLPLLYILSEYLSEENLAVLASHWTRLEGSCLNDVLMAKSQQPAAEVVLAKLAKSGFADWVDEPEKGQS